MKCPYCTNNATTVVDTRESRERVRRRRECKKCGRRFTTYETVEKYDVKVVKRSGEEENFDEEKIREGIIKAAGNRIDEEKVENTVESIKRKILEKQEITAEKIGELVKEELKQLDEVSYIRFASVYDSFENAKSFQEEIEALKDD